MINWLKGRDYAGSIYTKAAAAWYMQARRNGMMDPIMEDFLDGLTDEEIKQALEASNRLR